MLYAWLKIVSGLSFIKIISFPDKAGFPIASKNISIHEEQTKLFFFLNMFLFRVGDYEKCPRWGYLA